MMHKTKIALDVRGYSCPISIALIVKSMKLIDEGCTVEIISDDDEIKKDIQSWCIETGNAIHSITKDESNIHIEVIKGNGYKPQSLVDFIRFILLGVTLHIRKFIISIVKKDYTHYLIIFVFVAEGMRAQAWLQENHPTIQYVLLPVPNDITKHCGVVTGAPQQTIAIKIFLLLHSNGYKVEDIYQKKGIPTNR